MSLILYYGSGSPYAWRAHLALEHKALPYELKILSFSEGDTRKPEFVALNPRHQVPVLVDGDFVLYESNAIVEYLDEAYPATGEPLFPGDPRTEERNAETIAAGKKAIAEEAALFTAAMRGEFLAGPLSAADFALYPLIAFARRCEEKKLPDLGFETLITPQLSAWKRRIEALPFFDKTIPPHWKAS